MIHLHTEFHMPNTKSSFVTTVKLTPEENFRTAFVV